MRFYNQFIPRRALSVFLCFTLLLGMMPIVDRPSFAATQRHIEFSKDTFKATSPDVVLSGDAEYDDEGDIHIVPHEGYTVGGVFTSEHLVMGNEGFSIAAEIQHGTLGTSDAGGYAIVLSKDHRACTTSIGAGVGYNGMAGESVAVLYNNDTQEITFMQNGSSTLVSAVTTLNKIENTSRYLWLDYDLSSQSLVFYISDTNIRPDNATGQVTLDLSSYVEFYLGMTAATATSESSQDFDLEALYYDTHYQAESLKLDGSVQYDAMVSATNNTATFICDDQDITGFMCRDLVDEDAEIQTIAATHGIASITGLKSDNRYAVRAYTIQGESTIFQPYVYFSTVKSFTVTLTGGGYIKVDGNPTTYDGYEGESITIEPIEDGNVFLKWCQTDGTVLSTDATYSFDLVADSDIERVNTISIGLNGSGTKAEPYTLSSEADLTTLSDFVNGGQSTNGVYFEITSNISVVNDFTPIGTEVSPFRGVLKGNDFTISDITESNQQYSGLFGYVSDAQISNVTLYNPTLINLSVNREVYMGGIVGYATGATVIDHCKINQGTLQTDNISYIVYEGGIVGFCEQAVRVTQCEVALTSLDAEDDSYNVNYRTNLGGIAGTSHGMISFCDVDTSALTALKTYGTVGGIVGSNIGNIWRCNVLGAELMTIVGDDCYGGIAGYSEGNIASCKVAANISGVHVAGGLVGSLNGGLYKSEFNGDVDSVGTGAYCESLSGGLVGRIQYNDNRFEIVNNVTYGTVLSSESIASYRIICGGLVSFVRPGTMVDYKHNIILSKKIACIRYVGSLIASTDSAANCTTLTENYVLSDIEMIGDVGEQSYTGNTINPEDADNVFYEGLGFAEDQGWVLVSEGKASTALVEPHLAAAQRVSLAVSGNVTPYYLGMALKPNDEGYYEVYAGDDVTLKPDSDYYISSVSCDGREITEEPWQFTVTNQAIQNINVETERNQNAIWLYNGKYIVGAYSADAAVEDIDWTDAIDTSVTPLSGTYAKMDLHVFASANGRLSDPTVSLGKLDLGTGNIYVIEDDSSGIAWFCGVDSESYLKAARLYSETYVVLQDGTYELDGISSEEGINLYGVIFDINGDCHVDDLYMNMASGTINGAISVDDILDIQDSTASIIGDITIKETGEGLYIEGISKVDIQGDLTTVILAILDSSQVNLEGTNVTITYECSLDNDAVLDCSCPITTPKVFFESNSAVLLNATVVGSVPYKKADSEVYYRTKLTGLPANTEMTFKVDDQGVEIMNFQQTTSENGDLMVWLCHEGATIDAVTNDQITYSGDLTIGSTTPEIQMRMPATIVQVNIAANVSTTLWSNQKISYGSLMATAEDVSYAIKENLITVKLLDELGAVVALEDALSQGTYAFVVTYQEVNASSETIAYGTCTYRVTVNNKKYTLSYDVKGGSSVASTTVDENTKIALPISEKEGFNFGGWTDGTSTFNAGSYYTVTKDAVLSALWQDPDSGQTNGNGKSNSGNTGYAVPQGTTVATTSNGFSKSTVGGQTHVILDTSRLLEALEQNPIISVDTGEETAGEFSFSGDAARALALKGGRLQLSTDNINYELAMSALPLNSILSDISADEAHLEDVNFSLRISELDASEGSNILSIIARRGQRLIMSPVQFELVVSYGSNQVTVERFNQFLPRLIQVPDSVNPSEISTAVVVADDGTERSVPTRIIQGDDGKYYARVSSMSNSIYALVTCNHCFMDIEGKWYQNVVDEAASKMIVSGITQDCFEGDRAINRAEFVTALVNGLGLPTEVHDAFTDVHASDWYYASVSTANAYGLVNGRGDGTFDPEGVMTRQEAMVMVKKAFDLIGTENSDARKALEMYLDNDLVSSWAVSAVQFNVDSGIISGDSGMLRPLDQMTRAESAVVILKLLKKTGLINDDNVL